MKFIIFLIQCPDRKGLVADISTFFFQHGFNIVDSQQFVDIFDEQYFMRIKLDLAGLSGSREQLEAEFDLLAVSKKLNWSVHYTDQKQKVAILGSTAPHCIYDLLVRHEQKELDCDISFILSNHSSLQSIADKFKIPFHHLPIRDQKEKPQQENKVKELLLSNGVELIVLARYMQILSPGFTETFHGKIINIHHAILPAFQGANPYKRAYERGVKMIGATAHYATANLDEGPIIEQNVERVTHEHYPLDLSRIGADVECLVLAKAVKAHLERRIIISGNKTIVFS
jgi:formyltetrahydrofolate deformylase